MSEFQPLGIKPNGFMKFEFLCQKRPELTEIIKMLEQKMCRLCMSKDSLTSVWGKADGEKINEKIMFVCSIQVSLSDPLPKFVCHQCLSLVIIASTLKKKSLETDRILHDLLQDEVELVSDANKDNEQHDDPFYTPSRESIRNKYLVYEENPDDEFQPKIRYQMSESTVKIKNTKQLENPELKSFVDGYLAAKPNLEIIKVTNPESINDIERVIEENNELRHSTRAKRSRNEVVITSAQSPTPAAKQKSVTNFMQHSRLLSAALAGQRLGNITVSHGVSPLFNHIVNSNRN